MTDDTRKLIEEGSTPSGPGDFASAEDEADYWRNYAMRLRAALEVSLPTEDDREALRAIISEAESQTDDEGEWALPEDVADAILDAGFRRAPVPPETDRAVIERVARILAPRTDPEGGWRGYIGIARQLAGAGLLAAVPPVTEEPEWEYRMWNTTQYKGAPPMERQRRVKGSNGPWVPVPEGDKPDA